MVTDEEMALFERLHKAGYWGETPREEALEWWLTTPGYPASCAQQEAERLAALEAAREHGVSDEEMALFERLYNEGYWAEATREQALKGWLTDPAYRAGYMRYEAERLARLQKAEEERRAVVKV